MGRPARAALCDDAGLDALAGVKYWKTIANKIIKAGFSLGWASALDFEGRTIWVADAPRDDGKRFIVRADEKLTAFVELESVTRRST